MPVDDVAREMEAINLSNYADPNIEGILLRVAARGSDQRLVAIKDELRREEDRGWCKILLMTDELAVVRWHDQFVLQITDDTLALPFEGGGQ